MVSGMRVYAYALFLFVLAAVLLEDAAGQANYRLGPGDVVRIEVFGEEDLQKEATINEVGQVSFPLIGNVLLEGMTVTESASFITEKLEGRFLVDPKVTVSVQKYREFFVSGEVEDPGGYSFQPGLTVRSAISFAGGFKERASKKKIYVIRESDESSTPRKVKLDDRIGPGDVVFVEQSFF